MRGRIDRQVFGVSLPRPPVTTPNLIQQFDYGIAASELLQVKEKTPYPTLGDVVHPVILLDDLRASGRQPKRRWFACGIASNGAFAEFPCFSIRNNSVEPNDLIVVDRILISLPSAAQEIFFLSSNVGISQLATINPQTDVRASLANPTESELQQTLLSPLTGFTVANYGSTSLGGVAGDQNLVRQAALTIILEIPGPFVIQPGRALALRLNQLAANQTFAAQAYGHEYPG